MKIIGTLYLLAVLTVGCTSEDSTNVTVDENVIISADLYKHTNTDSYNILNASIEGDILTVTVQFSGCDGNSWGAKLVDSGAVAESYPVQRFTKIALKNEELCDAIVTKYFTFDITLLRVEDQLYLNLEGWEEQLHYDF